MKTALAALTLLASAFAAPAPAADPQATDPNPNPNPYPYSIDKITLYHLIESNTWDLTIAVTPRGPYGDATGSSVSCHTAWNDGATYIAREICADTHYFFWLPTGAPNPAEGWDVIVDGPGGQAEGAIAYGPKYRCEEYNGDIGNVDVECKDRNGGWFFLRERDV